MAFLFGRNRQKSSSDLPRLVKDLLPRIDGPANPKAEDLAKLLSQMKLILQGTHGRNTPPDMPALLK
jgi:calcium binding protein 39